MLHVRRFGFLQILLDAVSVFNLVTSTSLEKQSVNIAHDGVEVGLSFSVDPLVDFFLHTFSDHVSKLCLLYLMQYRCSASFIQRMKSAPPPFWIVYGKLINMSYLRHLQTSVSPLGGKNLLRITVSLGIFGSLESMLVMYLAPIH